MSTTYPPTLAIYNLFKIDNFHQYEIITHCCIGLKFLIIHGGEFAICSLINHLSYSGKCAFLLLIFNRAIYCLSVVDFYEGYIWDTSPLSDVQYANIFSHLIACILFYFHFYLDTMIYKAVYNKISGIQCSQ